MRARFRPLIACLLAAVPQSGADGAQPKIKAEAETRGVVSLAVGSSEFDDAVVYRPVSAPAINAPVLVLFHGAGGRAARFIQLFKPEADRRGLILVSVQSVGVTWDIVYRPTIGGFGDPRFATSSRSGVDARRTDRMLGQLFGKISADPDRVIAIGFSDGASYALSLGLANPQLFRGVVALSPGFIDSPRTLGERRRIAITHGRSDRILPFDQARRIADNLKGVGYPVLFVPFDGDHVIETDALSAALDFVLASSE